MGQHLKKNKKKQKKTNKKKKNTLVQLIVLETSNNPDHTLRSLLLVQVSPYSNRTSEPAFAKRKTVRIYDSNTESNIFPSKIAIQSTNRTERCVKYHATSNPTRVSNRGLPMDHITRLQCNQLCYEAPFASMSSE